MNLQQFQLDVLHNRHAEVRAFIEAMAQEDGNERLAELGQRQGFRTWWEAESYDGHRVAMAKHVVKVFYGNENVTSLTRLCQRYNLALLDLRGNRHDSDSLIKDHFGLARTVNTANLVHWGHVLLIGAKGDSDAAREFWASTIMAQLTFAGAEHQSRKQTGLGLHENIHQQLGQASEALMWQQATDEFEAKQRWLLAIGYHPSTALLEAGKHTMRVTGMDLAADLNGSPLLQDVPPENQYYLVSSLEKRFELPREGQHGHFLNKLLANYGMQTRLANGEWQPTSKGQAERIHGVPVYKPATIISKQWSGPLLEWHVDFVAKVAEWYHRSHRQEVAHGPNES